MTNDRDGASRTYLAGHQGFGGYRPVPSGLGSFDRFVSASSLAAAAEREGDVGRWLKPCDAGANPRLVQTSFGRNRAPIPAGAAGLVGRFPDRFRCGGRAP